MTEASTEFEVSNSSEQASRTASIFAKETTEQAASKLTTRIREEQTIRTLEEFEEKNSHGFDNTAGDSHIVGIYQWIDKVYELQVYDYGIRLMFDVVVPEPAAFLLRTMELELASSEGSSPPKPIDIVASDLNFENYQVYASKYGASVEAPPPPSKTISHVLSREGASTAMPAEGEEEEEIPQPSSAIGATVSLPAGYEAFVAWVDAQAAYTGPDLDGITFPTVTMQIGNVQIENLQNDAQGNDNISFSTLVKLNSERDSLPIATIIRNATTFYATAEIWCIRSWRALEEWKLKTYDALVQAYRQRLSEYEEKMAEAIAREGVQIQGRNPAINRQIEREEFQRLAIKMIANEDFSDTHTRIFGFNRISFNIQEANRKGRFTQFWQSAIDWDNMTWELLPYYWSKRGSKWREKLLHDDVDPEHAAFVKAGAARLLLAVTPGFEQAVLHYLDTGEIWSGGDQPALANPRYAALLAEIEQNRDRQLSEEIPFGDPWEIKLPTTLVRLREDGSLPEWRKDAEGVWSPIRGRHRFV